MSHFFQYKALRSKQRHYQSILKKFEFNNFILKLNVSLLILMGITFGGCQQQKAHLTLFAASGTRLVIEQICAKATEANQQNIDRNYASSGTLARQIQNGAPCDIFISANRQWIDYLIKNNLIAPEDTIPFATTTLVWIAPKNSNSIDVDLKKPVKASLWEGKKLAVGDPAYVPVGKYAKQALTLAHWYKTLQPHLVLAKDVSSVLHYVELGACDYGLVYFTEAIQSDKIKIIAFVPSDLHDTIAFYAAKIRNESNNGDPIINKIYSPETYDLFVSHGFDIPGDTSKTASLLLNAME